MFVVTLHCYALKGGGFNYLCRFQFQEFNDNIIIIIRVPIDFNKLHDFPVYSSSWSGVCKSFNLPHRIGNKDNPSTILLVINCVLLGKVY